MKEKLAHQLNQTRLTSSKSIFTVPPSNQLSAHVNNYNNSNTFSNTAQVGNTWESQPTASQPPKDDEGWGDGPPSYTSISQGTYFGFNSIMEASKLNGLPVSNTPISPAGERAFGQFKNTPVTFTSAAATFNTEAKK
ncbi:unnamed protein product [Mucor hiemalis]